MSNENVLTPYEKVLAARKSDRPDIMKYIEVLFDDFIEMHGDRYYKDDKSLVAGIASFNGKTVTVIGNRKGKNIEENIRYNFIATFIFFVGLLNREQVKIMPIRVIIT